MDMLDKTHLQWLLVGIGVVVIALIYLWGMRRRIQAGLHQRRRRPTNGNEPMLGSTGEMADDLLMDTHEFGELGRITPDHHLADKVLVDVEIRPVRRDNTTPVTEAAALPMADPVPDSSLGSDPTEATAASVDEIAPFEALEDINPQPTPPVAASARQLAPLLTAPPKLTVALTVLAPRGQPFKGPALHAAASSLGFQSGPLGLFDYGEDDCDPLFSMAHLRRPGLFDPQTLNDLVTPGLLLFMHLPGPLEEMKALDLLVVTADQLVQKLGGMIGDERRHRLTNQGLLHLRSKVADFQRLQREWVESLG